MLEKRWKRPQRGQKCLKNRPGMESQWPSSLLPGNWQLFSRPRGGSGQPDENGLRNVDCVGATLHKMGCRAFQECIASAAALTVVSKRLGLIKRLVGSLESIRSDGLMKTCLAAFVMASLMSVSTLHAQQPGALGVTMSDNSVGGVLINNVVANSPAARIGLRPGDRILAVNNQPTANYRDVMRIIGASHANSPVELTIARGTWQGKLTADLGSAATVFYPSQQYVPASRPTYGTSPRGWGPFPRDWIDNGSRGAAASYGGGGY